MRKGMRQPHEPMAASERVAARTVESAEPSKNPINVENSSQLTVKPRRRSGAYSARNVAAPPYSPPVEKPWRHRSKRSSRGAAKPICA